MHTNLPQPKVKPLYSGILIQYLSFRLGGNLLNVCLCTHQPSYYEHLFKFWLIQIPNRPILWHQHVYVILNIGVGARWTVLLVYWGFSTQPSLAFTENDPKKIKYPVYLCQRLEDNGQTASSSLQDSSNHSLQPS